MSFEIQANRQSVELWADVRLPFEPKGPMKEARGALRDAVRSITPLEQHWLAAEYISSTRDFVDLENVLFYNVGTGVFAPLITQGLRAQRAYRQPRPSPSGRKYDHYQRYGLELVPSVERSGPLLRFQSPRLRSTTKPHDVWWSASSGTSPGGPVISGRFSLFIEVPESEGKGLAGAMKPLLDGIISSMHPVKAIDLLAVERLSNATGWESPDIARRLERPAAPVLHTRAVLTRYRKFVKWDPADDQCDAFTVHPSSQDGQCRVWIEASGAIPEMD